MAVSTGQEDKKKALGLAIAQIEKNCGKGAIMKMGSTDRVRVESWWMSSTSARLLFAEYLKYLRAVVRTQTPFVLSRPGSI